MALLTVVLSALSFLASWNGECLCCFTTLYVFTSFLCISVSHSYNHVFTFLLWFNVPTLTVEGGWHWRMSTTLQSPPSCLIIRYSSWMVLSFGILWLYVLYSLLSSIVNSFICALSAFLIHALSLSTLQGSMPAVSWLDHGDPSHVLVYADYASLVCVYCYISYCMPPGLIMSCQQWVSAPWGDGNGGLFPPGLVASQDILLHNSAHHYVELSMELQCVRHFCISHDVS